MSVSGLFVIPWLMLAVAEPAALPEDVAADVAAGKNDGREEREQQDPPGPVFPWPNVPRHEGSIVPHHASSTAGGRLSGEVMAYIETIDLYYIITACVFIVH